MDRQLTISVSFESFNKQVIEQSHTLPVLVDFWAEGCVACKQLAPVVEKNASNGLFLLTKVNADRQPELVDLYNIRNLPTILIFDKGQLLDRCSGAISGTQLTRFLAKHIVNPVQEFLDKANFYIRQGNTVSALGLIAQARRAYPQNSAILLKLALIELLHGNVAEANRVALALPSEVKDLAEYKQLKARLCFINRLPTLPTKSGLLTKLQTEPANPGLLHHLALHYIVEERYEDAIKTLLNSLKLGTGKQAESTKDLMIELLDMLGAAHPLVTRYRRPLQAHLR